MAPGKTLDDRSSAMIVPGNDSAIPGFYHAGHDLLDDRHKYGRVVDACLFQLQLRWLELLQLKRIKEKAALRSLTAEENETTKQRLDKDLEELTEDNLEKELQGMAGPTIPSSPSDSAKDQTNPSAFWMDDVLTPKEKIELWRKFATYDPSDTYWKIVCINMALHLAKRKEERPEITLMITMTMKRRRRTTLG
ncbi:hypothetical protein AnigIFM63309_009066 [Aspergillus niger]|nr:hypothetical protein AnigIFM63309_009066 [Aspergillus niger]